MPSSGRHPDWTHLDTTRRRPYNLLMKRVVIIGAGLGGLSLALRLRRAGFGVTVLEKQPRPGGRSNVIQEAGFRVDTGPTILVMKAAFEELYRSLGLRFEERLRLVQLEPNYRIYFHDGAWLDLSGNMAQLAAEVERLVPGAGTRVYRFLGESARKYELGMPFVERNYDHITDLLNPVAGLRLLQTSAHQNLYRQVASFFDGDDRLTKAFSFHSMFLGLSPADALAMYSLITYADLALGMWFPMGGVYSIVEDLVALAARHGRGDPDLVPGGGDRGAGRPRPGRPVWRRARSSRPTSSCPMPTCRIPTGGSSRRSTGATIPTGGWTGMTYACSGYVLYLGVDRVYPGLRHQSLFFSEDYRANLDAIFKTGTLPADPSFHMNVPTHDRSLAGAGRPQPDLPAGADAESGGGHPVGGGGAGGAGTASGAAGENWWTPTSGSTSSGSASTARPAGRTTTTRFWGRPLARWLTAFSNRPTSGRTTRPGTLAVSTSSARAPTPASACPW